MSKCAEFVRRQRDFVDQIEKSRNGADYILYCELLKLDRQYLSSMYFSELQEKHVEYGKNYNLYREQGIAYKYTFVYLCDLFLKNGFQLPTNIIQQYNSISSEITDYKNKLNEKGNFGISTIKYILAIDLGLRHQMQEAFGDEMISEEIFPKYEATKQSLKIIETVFRETIQKHVIENFTPEELEDAYTSSISQRLSDLETQMELMRKEIEREGVFSLDNHPQYKKLRDEYALLNRKISEINAMTTPQQIEQLRAELLGKLNDYKAQYESLKVAKNFKGQKSKETLEKEKGTAKQTIEEFSVGGSEFETIKHTVENIKELQPKYQNINKLYVSPEIAELKTLIEQYEKQEKKYQEQKNETESKRQGIKRLHEEYKSEISRFTKLGIFQRLSESKDSNKLTRDIHTETVKVDKEVKQSEELEKQEEVKLSSIKRELEEKIVAIQKKYPEFNRYFKADSPIWKSSAVEFEKSKKILSDELNDLRAEIQSKEEKVRVILNMPSTAMVTESSVASYIAQVIQNNTQNIQALNGALNYANIETQHPGYYDNLETGIGLAEEEISRRR